eukprot:6159397-Pyramimonas_sp.AAC.1
MRLVIRHEALKPPIVGGDDVRGEGSYTLVSRWEGPHAVKEPCGKKPPMFDGEREATRAQRLWL